MKHKSDMKHEKKEPMQAEKRETPAHHMKMAHHHMRQAVKAAKLKHKK